MNYADAQNILDMRRIGAEFPVSVINRALELTGDKESSDDEIENTMARLKCSPFAELWTR